MSVARATRLSIAAGWFAVVHIASAQPNPYRTVEDWLDLTGFRALGNVSAVYPGASGGLWIAERCGGNDCAARPDLAPIIAVDERGRYATSFGAGALVWPHGLYVDGGGNVWVADGRGASGRGFQVFKFAPDGRELMRLGEAGVAGNGHTQFSGPTGVVVAADGSIFVTDGHEPESNHRVMKFAADGSYLLQWGSQGSAPGQFNVPHAIALDSRGRVFVADRDNDRIQIFDQNGAFLAQWTQFGRPSGIFIDAEDTIYVSDNQSNDARHPGWRRGIRVGNVRDGSVDAFIPDPEFDPGRDQETQAHGIAADGRGNIYGAEVWGQTVKQYVRAR